MACPLCGDKCTCSYVPPHATRATSAGAGLADGSAASRDPSVPGFLREDTSCAESGASKQNSEPVMIDPEPFEPTEEQFSASLPPGIPEAEFQMDCNHRARVRYSEPSSSADADDLASSDDDAADSLSLRPGTGIEREFSERQQLESKLEHQSQFWREEVASRVNSYRKRRSRKRLAGEFSMKLNFDSASASQPRGVTAAISAQAVPAASPDERSAPAIPARAFQQAPELLEDEPLDTATLRTVDSPKIIEFPRPDIPAQPVRPPEWVRESLFPFADELAEPVLDRPRILEVPEELDIALPAPISDLELGGNAAEEDIPPSAAGDFDLPLQVAPLSLRFTAAMLDLLVVLMGTAVFAMIVMKMAVGIPHTRAALALTFIVPVLFWAIYQYLFLVHAAMTPGMEIVNLRISTFLGMPATRRVRRWRSLVMVLSCVSLGLGFIWSLFDEDNLCWHDRVTRTYLTLRR